MKNKEEMKMFVFSLYERFNIKIIGISSNPKIITLHFQKTNAIRNKTFEWHMEIFISNKQYLWQNNLYKIDNKKVKY